MIGVNLGGVEGDRAKKWYVPQGRTDGGLQGGAGCPLTRQAATPVSREPPAGCTLGHWNQQMQLTAGKMGSGLIEPQDMPFTQPYIWECTRMYTWGSNLRMIRCLVLFHLHVETAYQSALTVVG